MAVGKTAAAQTTDPLAGKDASPAPGLVVRTFGEERSLIPGFRTVCNSRTDGSECHPEIGRESLAWISPRPPASSATSIRVAPASIAFSISSLTTDAGRSTTSPAAMRLATASGRRRIAGMGGSSDCPPAGEAAAPTLGRQAGGQQLGAQALASASLRNGRVATQAALEKSGLAASTRAIARCAPPRYGRRPRGRRPAERRGRIAGDPSARRPRSPRHGGRRPCSARACRFQYQAGWNGLSASARRLSASASADRPRKHSV